MDRSMSVPRQGTCWRRGQAHPTAAPFAVGARLSAGGGPELLTGPLAALMVAAELPIPLRCCTTMSWIFGGPPGARDRAHALGQLGVGAGRDFVLIRALEEVLRAGVPGAMPALLATIHSMIAARRCSCRCAAVAM